MSQPVQNLRHARQLMPLRQGWTIDHQYRHAQRPRGIQLGTSSAAACVLGHNQFNSVALHQRPVIRFRKRPARDNYLAIRHGQSAGFIHQPQQIAMLRLGGEILKVHAPNGQKDTLRRAGQGSHCAVDIRNMLPAIPFLRHPGRAVQRHQWHSGVAAGCNGITAHLRGKGMGGVDHMGDRMGAKVPRQPVYAAKTTHTNWQGLRTRVINPSGVGIGCRDALTGHGFSQRVGLCGAAKDQEMCHA